MGGFSYKINEYYFDNIDTETKAYFLGLLFADGSIKEPKNNRKGGFSISLQEEDGYLLSKICAEFTEKPVKVFHPPSIKSKGWKKRAYISISSNRIYFKLFELGCLPRKSKTGMIFPTLDEKLYPHFIRGFLDGDGSIILRKISYKYKRKTSFKRKKENNSGFRFRLKIAFCSTDKIFLDNLLEKLNVKKHYYSYKIRTHRVFILWIENNNDVEKCVNFLYDSANVYLHRKYQKILDYNMIIKSQAESTLSEGLETTWEI